MQTCGIYQSGEQAEFSSRHTLKSERKKNTHTQQRKNHDKMIQARPISKEEELEYQNPKGKRFIWWRFLLLSFVFMPHKKSRSKSPLPNLLQDLVMLHLRPSYFPRSLFLQSYHQTSRKKKQRFLRKDSRKSRNAEKSRISIETRALSNDDKTNPQKDLRDKEQQRIKIRKGKCRNPIQCTVQI